jgi:hypothetical protein
MGQSVSKEPDPKRAESGRKGGIASGEARRKRKSRSFLDALRDRVRGNPDELVELLMGSSAGAVVAARVLEKAGYLEPEAAQKPAPALVQHDEEAIIAELKKIGLVAPALEARNGSVREFGDQVDDQVAPPALPKPNPESVGLGQPEKKGVPFPSETPGSEPSRPRRPHSVEDDVRRCRAVLGLRTGRIDPYCD